MDRLHHLAAIWALLLSLLAPTMACALPNAQMTAQEHACCHKMKGNCGSMRMPTSHSCCQQSIQAGRFDAVQPGSSVAVLAILPSATLFDSWSLTDERVQQPQHSPPTSSPPAVSVLRI